MDKCLILSFSNAGIFSESFRSKDKMSDIEGLHDRDALSKINVPIGTLSRRHVANLLHVLFGERPSPSIRKTYIKPVCEILTLAEKSRVKITTVTEEIEDKAKIKKSIYPKEVKVVRKSIVNSWQPNKHSIVLNGKVQQFAGLLYWERARQYLGEELLEDFKKVVSLLLGEDGTKLPIEKVIEKLNAEYLENEIVKVFLQKLQEKEKTPFLRLLKGEVATAAFNQVTNINVRLTVPKGIEKIEKISGTIYVPINEYWINKLKNGTGTGTFLEGGVVFIKGVQDLSDNLLYETTELVE